MGVGEIPLTMKAMKMMGSNIMLGSLYLTPVAARYVFMACM
jgi:hypothetical protein